MKGALRLLGHSIKRVRFLLLFMGLLLAGFQVLLVLVSRSLHSTNAFGQIAALVPDFVRQLMGPSFISLMSFSGIITIGYFHIAVMGSLVGLIIAIATEPASEIETGFMDLVLSRPVARGWVIARSIAMSFICTAFVLALMTMGTFIGLHSLAPTDAVWPTRSQIFSLVLNLGVLMICWGGVALAIGSVSRRRGVAGASAGLIALTTFLLDYIARAWEPAQVIAWVSPFRYYSPMDIAQGRDIPAYDLWVLAGIAVTGFILAFILFSRRDI